MIKAEKREMEFQKDIESRTVCDNYCKNCRWNEISGGLWCVYYMKEWSKFEGMACKFYEKNIS